MIISGKSAYTFTMIQSGFAGEGISWTFPKGTYKVVEVEDNDNLYRIEFSDNQVMNQIMSSFTFDDEGTTANESVHNLYNWYLACINNHFSHISSPSGNSPKQDCPFNKTGLLSANLVSELNQAQDSDPILCAQDVPNSLSFDKVTEKNNAASATVYTHWSVSKPHAITVGLQNTQSKWQITSINCNMNP